MLSVLVKVGQYAHVMGVHWCAQSVTLLRTICYLFGRSSHLCMWALPPSTMTQSRPWVEATLIQ